MPLPSTGSISFSAIQTEFGGSPPISVSEYYGKSSLPASGLIGLSNFRGTSNVGYTLVAEAGPATIVNSAYAQQPVLMPSGIQAGDIILVTQFNAMTTDQGWGGGGPAGWGTSSGFTQLGHQGQYHTRNNNTWSQTSMTDLRLSFKIATGNEGATSITGFTGANATVSGVSRSSRCDRASIVSVLRPLHSTSGTVDQVTGEDDANTLKADTTLSTDTVTLTAPSAGLSIGVALQASYNSSNLNLSANAGTVLQSKAFSGVDDSANYYKFKLFTVEAGESLTTTSDNTAGSHITYTSLLCIS